VPGHVPIDKGMAGSGIMTVEGFSGVEKYSGIIEVLSDNVGGSGHDQNWYTAQLAGPVPLIENAFFAGTVERRWLGDRAPSPGTEALLGTYGQPFGFDTLYEHGNRLPGNEQTGWSYHGRVDFKPVDNLSLSFTGDASVDEWSEYRQEWLMNIDHTPRYEDRSMAFAARLTHDITPRTRYSISVSRLESERYRGDGVVFKDYAAHNRPHVNPELDDANLFWVDAETQSTVLDSFVNGVAWITENSLNSAFDWGFAPDSLEFVFETALDTAWDTFIFFIDSFTDPVNWDTLLDDSLVISATIFNIDSVTNPLAWDTTWVQDTSWTAVFVDAPSYYGGYLHTTAAVLDVRVSLSHEITEQSQLSLGADYEAHTLRYFRNLDATKGQSPYLLNRYGFDEWGEESDDEGGFNDVKKPFNYGIWAQHRFETGHLVITTGMRVDRFDANALTLRSLTNPLDPNGAGDSLSRLLDLSDLTRTEGITRCAPRLSATFAPAPEVLLFARLGRYHQLPPYERYFSGWDFVERRLSAGSYFPFPLPTLEPSRTELIECGYELGLSRRVRFDATVFYRRIQSQTRILHISPASPSVYDTYGSEGHSEARGMDLSLDLLLLQGLGCGLNYSRTWVSGTDSDADDLSVIVWQNPQGMPLQVTPLAYDRRHKLVGFIDCNGSRTAGPRFGRVHPLGNMSVVVLVQAASGWPYTPFEIGNAISESAFGPAPVGSTNSRLTPWMITVDLKAEKRIEIGGIRVTPFVWIKNLFDRKNINSVYYGTGSPETTGWLDTQAGQDYLNAFGNDALQRYLLKQANPTFYAPPRQVYFGLRAEF
jgi:hypothetical protein